MKFAILYTLEFIQTVQTAWSDIMTSVSDCKAKGKYITRV